MSHHLKSKIINLATARRKNLSKPSSNKCENKLKNSSGLSDLRHIPGRIIISDSAKRTQDVTGIKPEAYANTAGESSNQNDVLKLHEQSQDYKQLMKELRPPYEPPRKSKFLQMQDRLMNKTCEEIFKCIGPFSECSTSESTRPTMVGSKSVRRILKEQGLSVFEQGEESSIEVDSETTTCSQELDSPQFEEPSTDDEVEEILHPKKNVKTLKHYYNVKQKKRRAPPDIMKDFRLMARGEEDFSNHGQEDWAVIGQRATSYVASDHLSFIEQMERNLTAAKNSTESDFPFTMQNVLTQRKQIAITGFQSEVQSPMKHRVIFGKFLIREIKKQEGDHGLTPGNNWTQKLLSYVHLVAKCFELFPNVDGGSDTKPEGANARVTKGTYS